MTERGFAAWIGVDQTGAVRPDGTPRPLRAAMVVADGDDARLVLRDLTSASREVFEAWTRDEGLALGRVAIALDAVIGVPRPCWPGAIAGLEGGDRPWALFARAAALPGWGRAVGEAFFAELLPRELAKELPRRQCERLAGANSVFVTRPFQKNVQTGTFRIWKDLASGGASRWANVGGFDARARVEGGPWLYEGYPSWCWMKLFGLRTRAPERFRDVLAKAAERGIVVRPSASILRAIGGSPDVADAAVLALGAACLDRVRPHGLRAPPAAVRGGEGWILGLEPARET